MSFQMLLYQGGQSKIEDQLIPGLFKDFLCFQELNSYCVPNKLRKWMFLSNFKVQN